MSTPIHLIGGPPLDPEEDADRDQWDCPEGSVSGVTGTGWWEETELLRSDHSVGDRFMDRLHSPDSVPNSDG